MYLRKPELLRRILQFGMHFFHNSGIRKRKTAEYGNTADAVNEGVSNLGNCSVFPSYLFLCLIYHKNYTKPNKS